MDYFIICAAGIIVGPVQLLIIKKNEQGHIWH